jgi:alkylation response protein AidB-like acyl-CoA dehydrogenase
MRASGSHIVDFTGQDVEPEWLLGGDNDYLQEPWFSAGAIRFAAVHVGGMHAVFDAAVTHLQRTKRIEASVGWGLQNPVMRCWIEPPNSGLRRPLLVRRR